MARKRTPPAPPAAGLVESTPEARLDAKLKAMFQSIERSRLPPVLADLDSLPGARRPDRRS